MGAAFKLSSREGTERMTESSRDVLRIHPANVRGRGRPPKTSKRLPRNVVLWAAVAVAGAGFLLLSMPGCRSAGALTRSEGRYLPFPASRSRQNVSENAAAPTDESGPSRDTTPVGAADPRSSDAPSEDRRWSRWLTHLGKPKRIPFPRTDLRKRSDVDLSSAQLSAPTGEESVF